MGNRQKSQQANKKSETEEILVFTDLLTGGNYYNQ